MRRAFPLSLLVLAACASVQTTSQGVPGAAPKMYSRLMVIAVAPDLRVRVAAESSFVRAADDLGAEIIPAHALFLPGRALSESEMVKTLRANHIPAVLLIQDGPSPPPVAVAVASGQTTCGSTWAGVSCQSSTNAMAGTVQDKFTVFSEVLEIEKGDLVWTGSTHITRYGATNNQLVIRFAKDVVQQLVDGGVLVQR